jgi:hypothetical protein
MPPHKPKWITPARLAQRRAELEREVARLQATPLNASFLLPCGCKVEQFNQHGIQVSYCERHKSFIYSPRHDGSDVFYFVNEEQKP